MATGFVRKLAALLICGLASSNSQAIPGDADGSGAVEMDDARAIARYVSGELDTLANAPDADATQDGTIDMEDAFAIATRLTGQSRILVVAPRHGQAEALQAGQMVRVEVFEKFAPFHITGGSVRIQSSSTGYDSGERALTFEHNGRSLYFHWDTTGLEPAADYQVSTTLTDSVGVPVGPTTEGSANVSLDHKHYSPHFFAETVDAFCPAPGMPLVFRRIVNADPAYYPYLGPLGRGWWHNYNLWLDEGTDGGIEFHTGTGISRFFESNADGTYDASPGDYGQLTRDANGTFQLREKDGLTYRFRSDLRFDYIEDLNGNRVTGVYDAESRLVEVRHNSGCAFSIAYNDAGRISALTDHVGRVTRYEYESPFPLIAGVVIVPDPRFLLSKVTDPSGAETKYQYVYGLFGVSKDVEPSTRTNFRLISIERPDGSFTQYEHDDTGRVVRETGTWGGNPITYTYNTDGTTTLTDALGGTTRVAVNDKGQPVTIVDPSAGATAYTYDAAQNLTGIVDPLGHANAFLYDEFGNLIQSDNPLDETTQFTYDLRFHKPASITSPLGHTTSLEYDTAGNLQAIQYPDASRDTYAYDEHGNLTSFTDAEGKPTQYSYNAQGQMTALQNALGHTTTLTYDTAGELEGVMDAQGRVTSHSRDTLGRLLRRTYPDGSHEDYEYDAAGKVTAFTNRRGERIVYRYYNTGQLEWIEYPSGNQRHFTFFLTGDIQRVDELQGETIVDFVEYERDANRRVTKVKVPGRVDPETYDVSYAYDAAGNRTFMAYPDGYSLHYEYDDVDRLTGIEDGDENPIVSYEYDAGGRRTKKTLGNGTYTLYQYDDLDRLTSLVNYSPDGAVQSSFEYELNDVGIRTAMTTLEGVHTYNYDDIYQLNSIQYPNGATTECEFDPAGNRITVTNGTETTTYVTNDLDQYTQIGSVVLTYDGNGNLSTRTLGSSLTVYEWDENNRLVGLNQDTVHVEYGYDYKMRLSAKSIGGDQTRIIWDGLDLISEVNISGLANKRYIFGATIDELVFIADQETSYWLQQDGLGSIVGATDASGAVIANISYDVHGNIREGHGAVINNSFAGMIFDPDSKLHYVRARWYSSSMGRFISPDPIGIMGGGTNIYRYANNSPSNYIDPYGLASLRKYTGEVSGPGFPHYQFFFDSPVHLRVGKKDDVVSNVGFIPKKTIGDWSGDLGTFDINDYTNIIRDNLDDSNLKSAIEDVGVPADWIPFIDDCKDWADRVLTRYDELTEAQKKNRANRGGNAGGDNDGRGGGECPTFLQITSGSIVTRGQQQEGKSAGEETLLGRLIIPKENILLRSNVPIYGAAGGEKFAEFRIEYGEGVDPTEWLLVGSSEVPRSIRYSELEESLLFYADAHLYGNMTDWNVGLKNWSHFPCNPPEDSTDLNGVYTLRLTVEGQDGEAVEDRVTVEVGRVIAQSLPGIAISPDERVVLRFPEQALTHPFRIYTILPLSDVGEEVPTPCEGCSYIGQVYRIREPGDRFVKDVALEFSVESEELANRAPKSIGLGQYDVTANRWTWLDTNYDQESGTFSTILTALPEPKAIYALMRQEGEQHSAMAPAQSDTPTPLVPIQPGILVESTFENDMGTIKERDHYVGAKLSLDSEATPDGSQALKLTNESHGGNFSSTLIDHPFDIREYGTLSFDYRIGPDVKIDFLLRVGGRWYSLLFTGLPQSYRDRDVNIASLGAIEGIMADDKWHSASVDLRYLLRQQTRLTRVDEIVMADWRVTGYRKLDFGNNARGATYYLDNLRITGPGRFSNPEGALLVDDFDEVKSINLIGGPVGIFGTPGTNLFQTATIDVQPASGQTPVVEGGSRTGRNRALALIFDTTPPDIYGGYWTSIAGKDLSDYSTLAFRLYAKDGVPAMHVGMRDRQGIEGKTLIAHYASAPAADGWREVRIPITGLRGLSAVSSPDVLFFSVTHQDGSGQGRVWIDDLRFESVPYTRVTDFEAPFDWTDVGGDYGVVENGAAAVATAVMPDPDDETNQILRIAYGGTIGKDYGLEGGGFSYAGWQAGLAGIDGRPFSHLSLRIRSEKGTAKPNFYLADAVTRWPLRAKELPEINEEWQTLQLPLEHYVQWGVDLSHLDYLQLVFEWQEQSGTVYLDDIRFERSEDFPLEASQ